MTFTSQLLSTAALVNQLATVDLDVLVCQINEKADRLKNCRAKGKKDNTSDEALTATASEDVKCRCWKGKCHNCDKPGHWAKECQSPKKNKDDSASTQTAQTSSTSSKLVNKPVKSANVTYDSEGDRFWMASEKAPDWTHLAAQEPDLMLGTPRNLEIAPHCEGKDEIQLRVDEMISAVITLTEGNTQACIELYNSGTTRHVSPYMTNFTSYSLLTPLIFLNTANQQRFPAIRCGTLAIRVPNGGTESELVLHGVLHAPAVGCTLVSVAALDEEGYHMHIGVGHLKLKLPQGECLGCIPRTQGHLYKVVHTSESVNAVEQVSLMELHRCLGHIAPSSAHKLVESKAISGIKLDSESQAEDCDACIFTWAIRLPVPKIRISPPSQHFGDQIHSNIWGPVGTSTCQGRKRFTTFMDDAMRYTVMYLLHTKDKAFEAYKLFKS